MSSTAVPANAPGAAATPPLPPPPPPRPPPVAVAAPPVLAPAPAPAPVLAAIMPSVPAPVPAPVPAQTSSPVPAPAAPVVVAIPPPPPPPSAPSKPAARRRRPRDADGADGDATAAASANGAGGATPGTQPPPRKKPRANARAKAAAAGAGSSASDGSTAGASIPPAGLASPSPTAASTPSAARTAGSGRGGRGTGSRGGGGTGSAARARVASSKPPLTTTNTAWPTSSADSADLRPPSTPTTTATKPARPRGRPARAAANAAPAASTNTAAHPLDAALKALESGSNSTGARPAALARNGSSGAETGDAPGAAPAAATTTTGSACAICRRGEDADDDFLQDWVMCDYCDEWLHPVCLLTPLADVQRLAKFACPACVASRAVESVADAYTYSDADAAYYGTGRAGANALARAINRRMRALHEAYARARAVPDLNALAKRLLDEVVAPVNAQLAPPARARPTWCTPLIPRTVKTRDGYIKLVVPSATPCQRSTTAAAAAVVFPPIDPASAETDDDVPRHLAAADTAARGPPTHFLRSRTDCPTEESSTPVAAAAEACLALATWAPVAPPSADPHPHPPPPGPFARARSRSDMHFAAPAPAVYSLLAQYPGFYPAPAPAPAARPPNGGFHAHAHAAAVQPPQQQQVPAWGIQSPDPTPLASPTLATDPLPRWPATAAVHGSMYAPVVAVDAAQSAMVAADPAAAYLSPWHDRAPSTSSITTPWPAAAAALTAPAPTVFSTATPSRGPTATTTSAMHAPVLFDPAVVTCSAAMPHAHYAAFPTGGLVPARIPTPTLTPAAPIAAAAAPPSSTGSSSPHVHAIPAPPHPHHHRPRLPTGPILNGLHMRSDTAATVVEDIAAAAVPPTTLSDAPSECAEDVDEDVHLAPVRVPDDDARPVALPRLPALAQLVGVAGGTTSPRMTPAAAPRSSPLVVRSGSSAGRLGGGGGGGARSPPEPGVGAARVAS